MNQSIANQWAAALESGTYLKGKGKLVATTGVKGTNKDRVFSATGVLAQLAMAAGYTNRRKVGTKYGYQDSAYYATLYRYSATRKNPLRTKDIPNSVLKFAGMGGTKLRGGVRVGSRTYPCTIEQLNDTGVRGKSWSFKSLAKLIRSRYADIG